jgi:hypothetical protein
MYRAELHGKLSPKVENSEDILTSNVFSFFMYSNREIFLKEYLKELGFRVSSNEAETAEFVFWPSYDDYTQPDVILLVGDKYLLFEAKYLSDFGKETDRSRFQPAREIYGGLLDAKNLGKTEFKLIAITADYCYQSRKFEHLDKDQLEKYVIWTNWQKVASCIRQALDSPSTVSWHERLFALDLLDLLEKKKLRSYEGNRLFDLIGLRKLDENIFLDPTTTRFRGEFIGFSESLLFEKTLEPVGRKIFYRPEKGASNNE